MPNRHYDRIQTAIGWTRSALYLLLIILASLAVLGLNQPAVR